MPRQCLGHTVVMILLVLALATPAAAQPVQATTPSGELKFILVPYAWGTSLSGKMGVSGMKKKVHVGFGDMTKYLNFAAMCHAELQYRERVGLFGEFNYAWLEDQTSYKSVSLDGQMHFLMSDVAAFYRLGTFSLGSSGTSRANVDLLGGARLWRLDMRLNAGYHQYERSVHIKESWVDPIVGVRSAIHLNESWLLDFRGGVGGFGIGSAFTWDAMGLVGYSLWEQGTLLLGYRAVGVTRNQGSGRSSFEDHSIMHGPIIGLSLVF